MTDKEKRDALKKKVSAILVSVLNGSEANYRTKDGIYIRWGLVERDIHAAIDAESGELIGRSGNPLTSGGRKHIVRLPSNGNKAQPAPERKP